MKIFFGGTLTTILFALTMGASIVHKEIQLDHDGAHYKISVDVEKHKHGENHNTDESDEHTLHHEHENNLEGFEINSETIPSDISHHNEEGKHKDVTVHIELGSGHEHHHDEEGHHNSHQEQQHKYVTFTHENVGNHNVGEHISGQYTHDVGPFDPLFHSQIVYVPHILKNHDTNYEMFGQYPQLSHFDLQHKWLGDHGLKLIHVGHFNQFETDEHFDRQVPQDLNHNDHASYETDQDEVQVHVTKHYPDQENHAHQRHQFEEENSANVLAKLNPHVFPFQSMKPLGSQVMHQLVPYVTGQGQMQFHIIKNYPWQEKQADIHHEFEDQKFQTKNQKGNIMPLFSVHPTNLGQVTYGHEPYVTSGYKLPVHFTKQFSDIDNQFDEHHGFEDQQNNDNLENQIGSVGHGYNLQHVKSSGQVIHGNHHHHVHH